MLKEKVQEALNKQINYEIYSSYLYLSMAAYFKSVNLDGFSNWMEVQAQEELFHAKKFYDFIHERGGRVTLQEIKAPPTEWPSTLAVFEATLEHERHVTALIDGLVNLALDERDHATNSFLAWFVGEQVEEEASVDQILETIRRIGDAPGPLFMLDRELGARTFTPPTPAK